MELQLRPAPGSRRHSPRAVRALIGNFAVANPTRPLMELILDWPLHHRSASDLHPLFGDIGAGVTIEQEATGVNLFAVINA